MKFKRLTEQQLDGQRVLIRADLNVPQDDAGNITEDTRIRASLPAIEHCLKAGARLMVTSHLGRPTEGEFKAEDSLSPIVTRLEQLLAERGFKLQPIRLIRDWAQGGFDVAKGEIVVLENCRVNRGEKKNSPELAQAIAKLCDIYVNDAFGTAHRAEATTHGVAQFAPIACAGPLLAAELDALGKALGSPKRPLVAIVAGSKVSTKLTILKSLAGKVDQLIVGGGIANTFMMAQGLPVGKSLVEADLLPEARAIIELMQSRGAAVPIPTDVVVAKEFSASAAARTVASQDVVADDMILDIGPDTSARLSQILQAAGTIVWNGPVGVFEIDQFSQGTAIVAKAIGASAGFSIAGGGDTLAAIAKFGITEQVDYISTGGGAFLEFLEGKTLPAVEALEQRYSK